MVLVGDHLAVQFPWIGNAVHLWTQAEGIIDRLVQDFQAQNEEIQKVPMRTQTKTALPATQTKTTLQATQNMPASLTAQTKKTNDRAASTGQANPPENTMAWYRRQAIVKTPAQPLPNPIQPSPTLAVPPLGPVLLKKQSRIIKLIGNFNKAEYAAFESRSRASRRGAGKEETKDGWNEGGLLYA